jgi:branched-chain amino acid transport system substrate-binding protein
LILLPTFASFTTSGVPDVTTSSGVELVSTDQGEMMGRHRWGTALALAMTATLVVAACGSDSKSITTTPATTAGSTATTGAATTSAAAPTTSGGTATTAPGTTAASSGSATTGAPAPAGVGLVGGVYKGTSGFALDPKDCPADWDPKQGITATDINLFLSLPTSGALAGFGLVADGAKAYYKYINDNGGIGGRNINLDVKDDGYKPDQTKTNVDEALGSNKYAALYATLGTPNNLAIWDETNDECMPQVLNGTGAAQWGDVEGHPWTTGMQLDYFTEASLWAKWLATEHPEVTTVGEVTYNSDFGQSYHNGFAFAIKGTKVKVLDQETHEATAPNLTNQFTSLAAANPQVLLIETSGAFCTQAMAEVEKEATWHPIVIMSGTCGSLNQFFKPLIDQGLTGKDTYLIQNFIDVNDPANANDDIVKLYNKVLPEQGLDPKVTTYATGWIFAWFMVDILKKASTFQGGLDRGNIMLAARDIHETNPFLIKGLTSVTDGTKDAYLTEGGKMVKYTVTDPKVLGTYKDAGNLINLEGQLGTYKTVQDAAASATTQPAATTTAG